ncbi:hypothetical protein HHI36_010005 [Cryptolaemus montrouzieri]|uniref:Ubinuclein-1 n=1 Tax=Cryptolaemus montrouzieri TaxID=559131 RepID=A0ABD2MHG8_9CUCU
MSDLNRVSIPYGSQSVSNKSKNVTKKTIRIVVTLPQSNEDTCPEYNYKDELDAAKKRGSTKNTENGNMLDMYGDDDDKDVRRIAMQMEEKYGKGVAVSKKRRRGRKDDYADIGMGYDESDSFIDNTDGYDEIIPQNVTTLHGGFYINCGALEFKTDDEESMDSSSSSSRSNSPSSRNGKRSLDSDESETEGDKDNKSKKLKLESGVNGMQKALKKKLFSPNKILKKKRSSNILKKTVRDLLKEKRKDLNMTVGQNAETDIDTSVLAEEDRLSSQNTEEVKPVQLPENLPNNIAEIINKIKQIAVDSSSSNKFTDEINILLLSLERKCKCLGKPSKTKVYEHLSYFMKVEKKVLVHHCNQLMLKDEEKKIKYLLQKLKAEIDKLMPSIISNYEKECELVLEKRNLLQQQSQEGGDEKKKSIGRPKRKFQWNDQTRKYLKDTATIKKRSYLQQGNSKESWEEELTTFLKNNMLHLWPEGWMTMTTLTKVCNKLFNDPKTANQPASIVKKENKNTAMNTPSLPYPNVTAAISNAQNKVPKVTCNERILEINKFEKISNSAKEHKEQLPRENLQKEHHKEQPREKEEVIDTESNVDKKNNNGNMFFKVDYEKQQAPASIMNTKELFQEVKQNTKFPNINVIELDGLNNFSNLLPKTKSKLKSDFDYANYSKSCKNATSENIIKEKPVVKEFEIPNSVNSSLDETHRNPSDGDDILKVMENLKNLQKMSSPIKTFEGSSSSTGFSQKASSVLKNNLDLMTSSFQDEFQKQLYNALGNLAPNTTKSNYKCS